MSNDLLVRSREVKSIGDCHFYHVMEVPGHGEVRGDWDLRQGVDDYLGHVSFQDKRVLEIGPASGFMTFEMEKRGARVVCVEVSDDPGWDFVPYPQSQLAPIVKPRREIMRRLKNSFWFAHRAFHSDAAVYYGSAYDLPEELGSFDVALMGSVLLHCHSPLQIVAPCALRARTLIITDMFYVELEGKPVCRLAPTPADLSWHTWWHFSTALIVQFLGVLGFDNTTVTTHVHHHRQRPHTLFTVVATRSGG